MRRLCLFLCLLVSQLHAAPSNTTEITYPGNMVINSNLVVSNSITAKSLTSSSHFTNN
jgi:hypothetical protein